MTTNKYQFLLSSDTGQHYVSIHSTHMTTAIKLVCEIQGCPECAIISVLNLGYIPEKKCSTTNSTPHPKK